MALKVVSWSDINKSPKISVSNKKKKEEEDIKLFVTKKTNKNTPIKVVDSNQKKKISVSKSSEPKAIQKLNVLNNQIKPQEIQSVFEKHFPALVAVNKPDYFNEVKTDLNRYNNVSNIPYQAKQSVQQPIIQQTSQSKLGDKLSDFRWNTPKNTFSTNKNYLTEIEKVKSTGVDNFLKNNLPEELDLYLKKYAPNTKIIGTDIIEAAKKYDINPGVLVANLQYESFFGTKGSGAKNNSPGGVGQYDKGQKEKYKSLKEGIENAAFEISRRRIDKMDENGNYIADTQQQKSISPKLEGSILPPPKKKQIEVLGTYKGNAECVGYARTINKDLPSGLFSIKDKIEKAKNSDMAIPGSVAIMNVSSKGSDSGHVGVVESVNKDGTITIREANYKQDSKGNQLITRRTDTPENLKVVGYFNSNSEKQLEGLAKMYDDLKSSNSKLNKSIKNNKKIVDSVGTEVVKKRQLDFNKIAADFAAKYNLPLSTEKKISDIEKSFNTDEFKQAIADVKFRNENPQPQQQVPMTVQEQPQKPSESLFDRISTGIKQGIGGLTEGVTPRNFLESIPESINTVGKAVMQDIPLKIAQITTSIPVSIALGIKQGIQGGGYGDESGNWKPESRILQTVFGKDVQSYPNMAKGFTDLYNNITGQKTEHEIATPVIGLTLGILDSLTFGTGRKIASEMVESALKEAKEVPDVVRIVEKIGGKISPESASIISKTQDLGVIRNELEKNGVKINPIPKDNKLIQQDYEQTPTVKKNEEIKTQVPGIKTVADESEQKIARQLSYLNESRQEREAKSLHDILSGKAKEKPYTYKGKDIMPTTKELLGRGVKFDSKIKQDKKDFAKQLDEMLKGKKKGVREQISDFFYPTKNADKETKSAFGEFFSKKIIAEEKARTVANKSKNIAMDELILYSKGVNTKNSQYIKDVFDRLRKDAENEGIAVPFRENYIPQVWKEKQEDVIKAVAQYMRDTGVSDAKISNYIDGKKLDKSTAERLKINPSFTQERALPSYEIGKQYGLTPKYSTLKELVGHYTKETLSASANFKLLNDLVASKKLSGSRINSNWVEINAMNGLYAEPETARILNGMFENQDALEGVQKLARKLLSKGAKLNRVVQEFALSGTPLPNTNLNIWTLGQLNKSFNTGIAELLSGNIRGASTEFKAFINFVRSNSTKQSLKWFESKNDIINKMAKSGVDVSYRIGKFDDKSFIDGLKTETLLKTFGKGFDKLFNEKTFRSFQPMQVVTIFEDSYKTALRNGLSEDNALTLAKEITQNYMGMVKDPARSKLASDILSSATFAPVFRESIVNVLLNSFKGLTPKEFLNPAYSKNRKLLAGMIMSFIGYQVFNKKMNGTYTWENGKGNEFSLKIPYDKISSSVRDKIGLKKGESFMFPFMPSFFAFPRNIVQGTVASATGDWKTAGQKFGSILSMPLKTSMELKSNRDYFGNEIYDETAPVIDRLSDMLSYAFYANSHPYLKFASNEAKIYKNQDKLDKFKDIIDTEKSGDVEKARSMLNSLSKEDKKAYYELKEEKIDNRLQALAKVTESPFTVKNEGAITKTKMYEEREKAVKDIKKLGETEQLQKVQEYLNKEKNIDSRKSLLKYFSDNNIDTTGAMISEDLIKIRPTYEKVQELIRQNKEGEAQSIIDKMTDNEYKAYKKAASSDKRKESVRLSYEMEDIVYEIKDLVDNGNERGAQSIIDKMTDKEYNAYKAAVTRLGIEF